MTETRTFAGRLRTFLIVTLITVMVWLLAESRMVRTRTLEPQVVLTTLDSSSGGALVVRQQIDQPQVRTVSVQIEGSMAGLDRFVRLLQSRIELRVGREIPATPGVHVLDLRQLLRDSPDLAVNGLIITQVSPPTLIVEVDELEARDFPIRVVMPSGVELDGVPRADPASVHVIAPASLLAQVEAQEATVEVSSAVVSQLALGRLETIPGVFVNLPGIQSEDWATKIYPAQVDVRVTLRSQIETWTIDRLPVSVLIAPSEMGRWSVQIDDADKDLVNVMISGPAESIEMLKTAQRPPQAFVTLSFEDLGRGVRSKTAQIHGLPSGCRLVSPEYTINLSISRVSTTESLGVDVGEDLPSDQ